MITQLQLINIIIITKILSTENLVLNFHIIYKKIFLM